MPLFDLTHTLLERALIGSSARQRALAHNLSNANTPGYQREDVDFHRMLASALEAGDATRAKHTDFRPVPDGSGPVRADGGTVDLDRELAALTENAMEYQALASIVRTRVKMLETVIGGRQ